MAMSAEKRDKTKKLSFKLAVLLLGVGRVCIVLGLVLGLIFFYPALSEELKYLMHRPNLNKPVLTAEDISSRKSLDPDTVTVPVDMEFGIVIPKIGANASVVPNVDPYDSSVYQQALTKGVAHAAGTVYPGQIGNVFLFSHSSVDFYEANRFNSVFYLLNKLKTNDLFYLTYKGEIFKYIVTAAKIVDGTEVKYMNSALDSTTPGKTATLMTCWPSGTTLKRLVVIGNLTE